MHIIGTNYTTLTKEESLGIFSVLITDSRRLHLLFQSSNQPTKPTNQQRQPRVKHFDKFYITLSFKSIEAAAEGAVWRILSLIRPRSACTQATPGQEQPTTTTVGHGGVKSLSCCSGSPRNNNITSVLVFARARVPLC